MQWKPQVCARYKARRRGVLLSPPRRSNAVDGRRYGFPEGAGHFWATPASFVVGIVTTMPPPFSLSRSKIDSAIAPIIRRKVSLYLTALMTCPACGFQKEETMPEAYFETDYTCTSCKLILKPKVGDDCVYCSYSNTVCPQTQMGRDCCSG